MVLESRGTSWVEQLAGAAGVDPAVLRPLVEAGRIDGLMDEHGRARLVFDDAVPGPEQLRALGVEPGRDYRATDVSSYSWAPDPAEDDGDHGPRSTWTMRWPDESVHPDRELALEWLRAKRRHVEGVFEGLTEEQARRPVLPSGWSPLAVVRHLALDVERWWFARVLAGQDVWLPVGREGWTLEEPTTIAAELDAYRAECARSDAIVLATAPGAAPASDYDVPHGSAREILLHVLVETATHAGHLDAARELLDGHQRLVLD